MFIFLWIFADVPRRESSGGNLAVSFSREQPQQQQLGGYVALGGSSSSGNVGGSGSALGSRTGGGILGVHQQPLKYSPLERIRGRRPTAAPLPPHVLMQHAVTLPRHTMDMGFGMDLGDSEYRDRRTTSGVDQARPDDDGDVEEDDLASLLQREDVMFPNPAVAGAKSSLLSRILHFVSLPYKTLFHFTVPDCSRPRFQRGHWYSLSILMCILFIAGLSTALVEWADKAGCIIGIEPDIMGLTVLAAGGSTPDAIASISVARAGQGGMGVSLAMGCNVFNVLFGLGLPWLLKTVIDGADVDLGEISIGILCAILAFVSLYLIGVFLISRWRLFQGSSYSLFLLYLGFVIYVLLRAVGVIGSIDV